MTEHYSVSELFDGQNQAHTHFFPEQPGICQGHRILTMADRFEQFFFYIFVYVTINHFPFITSLNSNNYFLLFHFFQRICLEFINTEQDEENNPGLGFIKITDLN